MKNMLQRFPSYLNLLAQNNLIKIQFVYVHQKNYWKYDSFMFIKKNISKHSSFLFIKKIQEHTIISNVLVILHDSDNTLLNRLKHKK